MQIPALGSVECAILHDEFKPVDGRLIFSAIQKLALELKFAPEVQLMVTSTEKDIHVHAGGHRILISQNDKPLIMDGFRNTLSTPYTGFVLPNANEIVHRHKANTFVTIGKGMIPDELTNQFADKLGDHAAALKAMSQFVTWDEANRAMKFCQELTKLIVQHHAATAIHWCTSDNLVPQSFFEAASEMSDFAMIGARPMISSSAGRLGNGLPIGAVFNGSQWLIGKIISFEEATVPLPWMMEVVMGFIKMCLLRGKIIPHNESFSVEGQNWTIGVYHEKIEGFDGWEMVKLIVVNAPEFGIYGDTSAKRSYDYQSKEDIQNRAQQEEREVRAANDVPFDSNDTLDPENDMDLAIMKKLQQKTLSEEEPKFHPANTKVEEWNGVSRNNDIKSLRELANRSRKVETKNDAADETPKRGFLRKFAGTFSKG